MLIIIAISTFIKLTLEHQLMQKSRVVSEQFLEIQTGGGSKFGSREGSHCQKELTKTSVFETFAKTINVHYLYSNIVS